MGVAEQGMSVSRQGLNTTSHNIANANTPGYSRQRVELQAREPMERNGMAIGQGVQVNQVARTHDPFLEKQIINLYRNSIPLFS